MKTHSVQHYENLKPLQSSLSTPVPIHSVSNLSYLNNNSNSGRRSSCTFVNSNNNSNNNNYLNNSILNYTTFEQNHYKFSLKENQGDRNDIVRCIPPSYSTNCIDDPSQLQSSTSSYYYYPISSIKLSNRGTKSDIGVPIRRQSMTCSSASTYSSKRSRSVKSDLTLLTEEHNLNNKMSPIIEPTHSYNVSMGLTLDDNDDKMKNGASMSDYNNFETDFNNTKILNDIVLYTNITKRKNNGPLIYIPSNSQMMRHHGQQHLRQHLQHEHEQEQQQYQHQYTKKQQPQQQQRIHQVSVIVLPACYKCVC